MLLVLRLALTKMLLQAKMLGEKQPTTHFRLFYQYHCLPWSLRLQSAQKLLAIFPSDQSIYPLPPKLKAPSDKLPHHINMIFMIAQPHDSWEFLIPFYYKLCVCQLSHTLHRTNKAGEIGKPQKGRNRLTTTNFQGWSLTARFQCVYLIHSIKY